LFHSVTIVTESWEITFQSSRGKREDAGRTWAQVPSGS
jgi:photosystem II stability/assembly factor-like uncharacterized protein